MCTRERRSEEIKGVVVESRQIWRPLVVRRSITRQRDKSWTVWGGGGGVTWWSVGHSFYKPSGFSPSPSSVSVLALAWGQQVRQQLVEPSGRRGGDVGHRTQDTGRSCYIILLFKFDFCRRRLSLKV